MALWDWVSEKLGYGSREEPENVKVRTKPVDRGWVRVARPNPNPDFQDDWHKVRKQRQMQLSSAVFPQPESEVRKQK